MELLFVSHCHPWPLDNGTAQRVYHLAEGLARRHRVTLVTVREGGAAGAGDAFPLRDTCARVIELPIGTRFRDAHQQLGLWAPAAVRLRALVTSPLPAMIRQGAVPELLRVLRTLRREAHFDAVWVERSFIAEMVRRAGFERIVVDVDEVESRSLRRLLAQYPWYPSKPLHYAEWAKLYAYERLLPRRFWRLVVCKAADRQFFGRSRHRVFVVPNGTVVRPAAHSQADEQCELLFVGMLVYQPNIDAIRYFHAAVLPQVRRLLPQVRFVVVGKGLHPAVTALHDGTHCIVASSVPETACFYERAALVVVPLRLGGGTRLKVLEALAHGKAVVSTSVGAEGLDVRPGVDIEIADDPATFARVCVRLLSDPAGRARLGQSGRARVLARYQWSAIAQEAARVLTPNLSVAPAPAEPTLYFSESGAG
jgi:glycosyltransferase involved in cell wall biosynthesis